MRDGRRPAVQGTRPKPFERDGHNDGQRALVEDRQSVHPVMHVQASALPTRDRCRSDALARRLTPLCRNRQYRVVADYRAPVDTGFNVDYDDQDQLLTLTSPDLVLQIGGDPDTFRAVADAASASWEDRQSVPAGRCLDQPVYWCQGSEPDTVQVLIGPDDETWSVAVVLSMTVVDDIVAAVSGAA